MGVAIKKMTINVPENLHRQAKAMAAVQGDTVTNVVVRGLEEYITSAVLRMEARIDSGEEQLLDWDVVQAKMAVAQPELEPERELA